MARTNAFGCFSLIAIPAALALSVAAVVYGAAAMGRGARLPPPPPGPDVIEGRAMGLSAEQPPLGAGVAYAELEVLCLKNTGRDAERTLLAKRVYGSPRLRLSSASQANPTEARLPPFSQEGWSGYSSINQAVRTLEGNPTEPFAPDWRRHPCDNFTVWMVRVLPEQYVILQGNRAWFGTREELKLRAEQARLAFRDRALLIGGLALLAWVLGVLGGRALWQNRSRAIGERGIDEADERA